MILVNVLLSCPGGERDTTIICDLLTCYTDGSYIDSKCGAGYIIATNNNNTRLLEASHTITGQSIRLNFQQYEKPVINLPTL